MSKKAKVKPKDNPVPPSDEFEDAFSSRVSGCVRECFCGRTCFDTYNENDWEEGEKEALIANEAKDPDHYHGLGYSVQTMNIDGKEFVMGCPCNGARPYEDWVRRHAPQLAKYLNALSAEYERKMEACKVAKVLQDANADDIPEMARF